MTKGRDNPLPLRDCCTSCLNPDGVLYIHAYGKAEYLCKKCAHQMALWEAADNQKEALLLPSLEAWHEIWGDVPGLTVGAEALYILAERLETAKDKREKQEVSDNSQAE